jgi:hypothetical protein
MFKEEIVGTIEKNLRAYDVCATADTTYDEAQKKLVVELDRFLRIRDISQIEQRLDEPWMPRKDQIQYFASRAEVVPTVNEVFEFWAKRVKRSIPRPAFFEKTAPPL